MSAALENIELLRRNMKALSGMMKWRRERRMTRRYDIDGGANARRRASKGEARKPSIASPRNRLTPEADGDAPAASLSLRRACVKRA